MSHSNQLSEDQRQQILAEYEGHGKLAAVKLHMELTGETLLFAKRAVEKILANESASSSDDGLGVSDSQMDQILDAIQNGQKIEAIKIYRNAKNCSLKGAKEFVEKLMATLEIEDPDAVGKPGCSAAVFFMVAWASVVTYWLSEWFG